MSEREHTDRMTVYVDAEDVQRRIKRLEINYDVSFHATKSDIHQAIFNVALDDEERLVAEIRRLQAGDDE